MLSADPTASKTAERLALRELSRWYPQRTQTASTIARNQ